MFTYVYVCLRMWMMRMYMLGSSIAEAARKQLYILPEPEKVRTLHTCMHMYDEKSTTSTHVTYVLCKMHIYGLHVCVVLQIQSRICCDAQGFWNQQVGHQRAGESRLNIQISCILH